MKNPFKNLSKFELKLWITSASVVLLSFILGKQKDYISVLASLIGITALIFVAKGDVFGQILTVVFSIFYGIISFSFGYYGEMITYLCMTAPIAIMSVITWLRNPYEKGKAVVKVNKLHLPEIIFMVCLSLIVTLLFYFILAAFNTTNLIISTISITTSFLASYLTFRRSSFYAIAYAANDIVLILLWVLATLENLEYLPMIFCFLMFLLNDIYGFINWTKMKKMQQKA